MPLLSDWQPDTASIFLLRKNKFITIIRSSKNAADVSDGINVIVKKPIEI